MLSVDGHDKAVVGVVHCFGRQPVFAYSVKIICETLVERDKMSVDSAYEFFEYNIIDLTTVKGCLFFYTRIMRISYDSDRPGEKDKSRSTNLGGMGRCRR